MSNRSGIFPMVGQQQWGNQGSPYGGPFGPQRGTVTNASEKLRDSIAAPLSPADQLRLKQEEENKQLVNAFNNGAPPPSSAYTNAVKAIQGRPPLMPPQLQGVGLGQMPQAQPQQPQQGVGLGQMPQGLLGDLISRAIAQKQGVGLGQVPSAQQKQGVGLGQVPSAQMPVPPIRY